MERKVCTWNALVFPTPTPSSICLTKLHPVHNCSLALVWKLYRTRCYCESEFDSKLRCIGFTLSKTRCIYKTGVVYVCVWLTRDLVL